MNRLHQVCDARQFQHLPPALEGGNKQFEHDVVSFIEGTI